MWKFLKHITEGPAAIVSAYKDYLMKEENEERHNELKKIVRERGYGYKEVEGYWDKKFIEKSLLIINIPFDEARELAERYQQDWFIYVGKDNAIRGYNTAGEVIQEFGKTWSAEEAERAKVKLYPRTEIPERGTRPVKEKGTLPFYYESLRKELLKIAKRLSEIAEDLIKKI